MMRTGMAKLDRISGTSGFLADERGTTVIEYAVIAAFLSIAIIVSVNQVGTDVVAFFTTVSGFF